MGNFRCVVIVQRKAGIDTYATLNDDGVSEDEAENCIVSQVGEWFTINVILHFKTCKLVFCIFISNIQIN